MLSMLENGLFALGQVLRLPVMILLWLCVFAAIYVGAACLVEWVTRRRERGDFRLARWLDKGPVLTAGSERRNELPPALRALVEQVSGRAAQGPLGGGDLENLVLEQEERVRHSVNLARALVRVAPSLGLIGTLIPMGASLASLASGNLHAMAGQMVVAFTTTIIGLATGTVAYVVTTIRQKWASEAVREQRYLAERVAGELAGGARAGG
jgi:biopolymer transport protein ExbB/TolQ